MPPRLGALIPRCIPPQQFGGYALRHSPKRLKSTNTSRTSAPPPKSNDTIDDYYSLLLAQPLPVNASTSAPSAAPPAPAQPAAAASLPESSVEARARIVFGSRLAGPGVQEERAARLAAAKQSGQGQWVSGIWIPPRPNEPDNCCMSGCVNCVWDGYREELEEWVALKREARSRHTSSSSMDDDGGGSEGLWDGKGADGGPIGTEGLFEGIPVGIREFMKTEKRIGERKLRHKDPEASIGG